MLENMSNNRLKSMLVSASRVSLISGEINNYKQAKQIQKILWARRLSFCIRKALYEK